MLKNKKYIIIETSKTTHEALIKYHAQKIFSICFQYSPRISCIGTIVSRCQWALLYNSLANHMFNSNLQKNCRDRQAETNEKEWKNTLISTVLAWSNCRMQTLPFVSFCFFIYCLTYWLSTPNKSWTGHITLPHITMGTGHYERTCHLT